MSNEGSGLSGEGGLGVSTRRRTAWVVALVVVVATSAALLDRTSRPAAAPAPSSALQRTGAWFCPHGGGPGWQARIVVANPARTPVRLRISTLGGAGGASLATFDLPAQAQVYRDVPAEDRGAATEVEYFGGWVGVTAVVSEGTGAGQRAAAERCLAGPEPTWYVVDQATSLGETAYLVAMNPFAEAAEFDVSLFTERRSVRPGSLAPFVVPAGRSVAIKLNDYVLLGQGENTLAVRVTSRIGRVVVGGTVLAANELREEAGNPGPAVRWVLPAGGLSSGGRLQVFNPGAARSDLVAVAQNGAAQQVVSGISGLSVPGGGIQSFPLLTPPDGGLVVESTNQQPMVAAFRGTDPAGQVATVAGVSERSDRWLVVVALPPHGGRAALVLENPDRTDARVQVTLFGLFGLVPSPDLGSLTIPAGRTVQVQLPIVSIVPVAALVTSLQGGVVPATWTTPNLGSGYAVVPGVPVPPGV